MGLVNFSWQYVPRYTGLNEPFTNRRKRMLTFWTKERQITFDKLKSVLANKAVVKIFDHKKEITVTTDASEH